MSEAVKDCSQQLIHVPGSELSCLGAVRVTGMGTYQFPAACPHPCSPAHLAQQWWGLCPWRCLAPESCCPRRCPDCPTCGGREACRAFLLSPQRVEQPHTKAVRAMSRLRPEEMGVTLVVVLTALTALC